ncbi:hypothetical protein IHQ71_08585 [Rhizobium sp. TH2]|uniref:hypothetical protein n=1 Tax=Rhizobium sp. TH2 TaxID=2775403 RepID=UPI002157BA3E|nr:hypothetical protein [Rhizobium sp. TH2]UVC10624.1 hypothetical protein IHQ71_08585 [Rhizobium sp. TH2]
MAVSNAVADNATPKWEFKNLLAWAVFLVSTFGILVTGYFAATIQGSGTTARDVFTTLVPLFSTWVGTILAFYFSRENFETANRAVDKAMEKLTPEQEMQQTAVSQVMKKRNAIKSLDLATAADEANVTIAQIRTLLDQGFSRIAIFAPNNVIKYIIHEGTLNKFIADNAAAGTAVDLTTAKLPEFLAFKIGAENVKDIVSKMAFVKLDANLQDARTAMLAVKGAQDVFVTKTGKKDEPVEGWVSNNDITKDI